MLRSLFASVVVLLTACGTDSTFTTSEDGQGQVASDSEALKRADPRLDSAFEAAGREFNVPPSVLKTLSWTLTGYVAQVPEADDSVVLRYGVMAIAESDVDALALQLHVDVNAVKTDDATNIRAAALLLSNHASMSLTDRAHALAWAPVVADYAEITDYDLRKAFMQGEFAATLHTGIGVLGEDVRVREGAVLERLVEEHRSLSQGLTTAQYGYARTMAAVARANGIPPELPIMTSLVETNLQNLSYGDRDSVGLFQQRTPWGTFAQRTNPAESSRMFIQGGHGGQRGAIAFKARFGPLTKDAANLGMWAQKVQVSAFPNRYAQRYTQAKQILAVIGN